MAEISDVSVWWIDRGIGHVVTGVWCGWTGLLCGDVVTAEPNYEDENVAPRRVCAECRRRLPRATKPSEADHA